MALHVLGTQFWKMDHPPLRTIITRAPPDCQGTRHDETSKHHGPHWKMDREESFSDWTVEILVNGTIHGRYHVHKAILAVGTKKSGYFAKLFGHHFQESKVNTSQIGLESLAADAFPFMLDYLYSNFDDLQLTNENATALHFLGQYFEIPDLCSKAEQFRRGNLDPINCAMYYNHAKIFHDEDAVRCIVKVCCRMLDLLELDSPLIAISDELFWIDLLKENKGNDSTHLSNLVLQFCSVHPDRLNPEIFSSVTEESVLPMVACEAAIPFMELEKSINPLLVEGTHLTSLQKRCVTALTHSWKFLRTANMEKRLSQLDPLVAAYALAQAMEHAKAESLQADERILPEAAGATGAGTESVNADADDDDVASYPTG